jgi:type I restriction enzyme R subunit
VIIDEAHSSQSGESSRAVNDVLTVEDGDDEETLLEKAFRMDGTKAEEDGEDWLVKQMKSRSRKNANVSYFAFTATPKPKTSELFGTKGSDGQFYPFSLYSMKQAIEEGFILDVLKSYTTYKMYFSLHKAIENDPEYSKSLATRVLVNAVDKSEHAIGKKVEIMARHFAEHIRRESDGKAKAMVVSKSRLHAVRYKMAIDRYFKENGYPFKALVAFSGTVKDGGMEYTEANMNGIPETQTKEQFKKDEYRFLIVAEKYQTGFDQPLLAAMYVDKKLGGVNAVQTLSRLNRTHSGKENVFVLDFANETEDIKESFQPYYTTTVLSEATEPNILYDLQRDILSFKLFDEREILALADMWHRDASPAEMNGFLDVLMLRWAELNGSDGGESEEQSECRDKITDYIKKYAFISQIITFADASLEAMYIFLRFYKRKLPLTSNPLPTELIDRVNLETLKIPKTGQSSIALSDETGILDPMGGSAR